MEIDAFDLEEKVNRYTRVHTRTRLSDLDSSAEHLTARVRTLMNISSYKCGFEKVVKRKGTVTQAPSHTLRFGKDE